MPITLTPIKSGPPVQSFVLADSVQLDSFGRLRVSEAERLFDSQQEYGLDTLLTWDAAVSDGTPVLSIGTASTNGSVSAGGNAVGPRNVNDRMTPITVSAQNGDYAILQSRQYLRYIPGKGHLILLTGVFAPVAGATAKLVLRTSSSGSVSDANQVDQADWNVDTFDGLGPSGVTLDFTKTQILVIQAQWLGVGRVVVGFNVDGVIYPAHAFNNANRLAVPYTQSFNLPVRLESQNVAGDIVSRIGYFDSANGVFLETSAPASGGTISFICCTVQSEGGVAIRGFGKSAGNGVTQIGVTTRRPICSIRNAAVLNGVTNRAHIELSDLTFLCNSNASYWELVYGGTLTGGTWAAVGSSSSAEKNIGATAISGGVVIATGYVNEGSGAVKVITGVSPDIRLPLAISKIDGLAITQPALSVVCTSMNATSSIAAAMNWFEQTI